MGWGVSGAPSEFRNGLAGKHRRPFQMVAHRGQPPRPFRGARGDEGRAEIVVAGGEGLDLICGRVCGDRWRAANSMVRAGRAGSRAPARRGRRWRPLRPSVLQHHGVERRLAADHVGCLLGDHQDRGVEVRGRHGRHDRGIDHAQSLDAAHAGWSSTTAVGSVSGAMRQEPIRWNVVVPRSLAACIRSASDCFSAPGNSSRS